MKPENRVYRTMVPNAGVEGRAGKALPSVMSAGLDAIALLGGKRTSLTCRRYVPSWVTGIAYEGAWRILVPTVRA